MSLSIREQSEQLQAASAARLPPDVVEVFSRNSQQLHARGIPAGVVKVGDALAPFTLYNAVGKPVGLEDLVATGPAVLVFYRGGWCPYCNIELRALQGRLTEIEALGASLLAIGNEQIGADLGGSARVGLSLATRVDRRSFGLDWNADLPSGGQALDYEVDIAVELEFVAEAE